MLRNELEDRAATELFRVCTEAETAQRLSRSLGVVLPGVYEALNRTAVQFQELQRDTLLNADELLALITIATANLQRWQRRSGAKGAPPDGITLVPASQSVVARATGTPRQTMRRRLERLIELGAVRATPRGLFVNFENDIMLVLLRTLYRPANPTSASPHAAQDG